MQPNLMQAVTVPPDHNHHGSGAMTSSLIFSDRRIACRQLVVQEESMEEEAGHSALSAAFCHDGLTGGCWD